MTTSFGVELPRAGSRAPYVAVPVLIGIVVVQTTVMHRALIGSTPPFLPLLAVICWSLLRGPASATWWAVALGIMLDVVSPRPAGFYTLPLLGVGTLIALAGRRIFSNNLLMPLGLTGVGTVLYSGLQYALLILENDQAWRARDLALATVPLVVLNYLWLPIVFLSLRFIARRWAPPVMAWERG